MSIKYDYHVTGTERKPLIQAISNLLGSLAVYQGAPTFAYAIGRYSLDRDGVLLCPDNTDSGEREHLIQKLQEQGFTADLSGENTPESPASEPEEPQYPMTFSVEMPRTGFTETALQNLQKIIASKETLLKKALGTDALEVVTTEEKLCFQWFTLHESGSGEADAYSRLIAALCRMARERKRVTAKECSTENAKFHMRLFLVQLGFIGDEYKPARKILLRNLSGNSSWKSGHDPRRDAEPPETPPAPPTDRPEAAPENMAETGDVDSDSGSGHKKGGEPYEA